MFRVLGEGDAHNLSPQQHSAACFRTLPLFFIVFIEKFKQNAMIKKFYLVLRRIFRDDLKKRIAELGEFL